MNTPGNVSRSQREQRDDPRCATAQVRLPPADGEVGFPCVQLLGREGRLEGTHDRRLCHGFAGWPAVVRLLQPNSHLISPLAPAVLRSVKRDPPHGARCPANHWSRLWRRTTCSRVSRPRDNWAIFSLHKAGLPGSLGQRERQLKSRVSVPSSRPHPWMGLLCSRRRGGAGERIGRTDCNRDADGDDRWRQDDPADLHGAKVSH
jgi:hypothetical protein